MNKKSEIRNWKTGNRNQETRTRDQRAEGRN